MTPMNNTATLAIGILGNITSFFLFMSPIPMFWSIFKAKTVGDFSGMPYVVTLLNCALWVFYGLPFVTKHHVLVVTINGIGLGFELIYITLHLFFGTKQSRKKVSLATIAGAAAFVVFVLGVMYGTRTHPSERKSIVGGMCLALNICMYGAPLTVMRDVIRTKSTEYMPFFLSLSCFLNGIIWFIYALLTVDIFIAIPNGAGALLSAFQLGLFAVYYKRTPAPKTVDSELASAVDKPVDAGPHRV